MSLGRLSRVIEMLGLLTSKHAVTAPYLAQVFGCSKRTVFRDLNVLREAGFDIRFDEVRETYLVAHATVMPRFGLTEVEVAALLLAARLSPVAQWEIFRRDVNQGIAKILSMVPSEAQERFDGLLRTICLPTGIVLPPTSDCSLFSTLVNAAANRRCVRILYQDESLTTLCTKLSLYKIFVNHDSWIVRARSSCHRAVIDMPVRWITSVQPLDETYQTPRRFSRPASIGINMTARFGLALPRRKAMP